VSDDAGYRRTEDLLDAASSQVIVRLARAAEVHTVESRARAGAR
jgi:hypothetical protein